MALVAYERVRGVVDAIAADLVTARRRDPFAIALFAYRARALGDESVVAERYVAEASEVAESTPLPLTLFGGVSGIGWIRAHLELDDESDADLEDQLAASLRVGWDGDYDLIAGLVGLGVYALERRARGSRSDLLEVIVDRLAATAEPADVGVTWRTQPRFLGPDVRPRFPDGWCNLGLAHGVAGVIALLGAATRAGVTRARPLLDRAVEFLLSCELPDGGFGAISEDRAPTRAAWCYGDPGIAIALLRAARDAGEPAWELRALSVARRAAQRPAERCGVVDACLCHGTAGLAHIFHRFYRATGEAVFRDAAVDWLERTLAMPRNDNSTLLAGRAGIALALLAAATDVEPAWDRLLLCST